jgi:hypothetical protein
MTYSLAPEYITAISELVGLSHGRFVTTGDAANEVIRLGLPVVYAELQVNGPVFNLLNTHHQLHEHILGRQRVLAAIEDLRAEVLRLVGLRIASAISEAQALIDLQRASLSRFPPSQPGHSFWAAHGLRLIDREIQPLVTPGRRGTISLLPRDAVPEEE